MESKTLDAFERLSGILDTLRQQCPWDHAQTMKSLRYLTIEEVFELSEAIIALNDLKDLKGPKDPEELSSKVQDLKKELGDLVMHIMFYAKIAEEQELFTMADVFNAISDKLVARHPFIYQKDSYHGENWEELKMREGRKSVLEGVPESLPSLVKAIRMQEKVAGRSDHAVPATGAITEEAFGDLLFNLVDWGRQNGINADDALSLANKRFAEKHK